MKRIVTGWDENGSPAVLFEGAPPTNPNFGTTSANEIWVTDATPPTTRRRDDPTAGEWQLEPPAGGSAFRVVQFPPDKDWAAKAAAMGGVVAIDETAKSASKGGEVRHAHMHRTRSLDYAIVLSGEIWAVMDVGETKLVAGDVLVQRGTNHAWANRSNEPCIIAFVLIDAKPLA